MASALFGPTLVTRDGTRVGTDSALTTPILVFFSASWCSPCKAFLPRLLQLYGEGQGQVQVVLVSCDITQEAYWSYLKGQPWYALPFDAGDDLKQRLHHGFQVASIPSVVALDRRGNLIPGVNRDVIARHPPNHVLALLARASSSSSSSSSSYFGEPRSK